MLLKKFFSHRKSLFGEINTKKFLSKNFFEKYLIRSNLMGSTSTKVLDTNTNIFNVQGANLAGLINNKNQHPEGFSLIARNLLYTNKRNNRLRFESFLCNFSSQYNTLESIYQSFKCLKQKNENFLNSLIVLKPIKGGFNCYCSGVVGFLPRSHGLRMMEKILSLSIKAQAAKNKEKLYSLDYFLGLENFTDKYFTPRASFDLGQAGVHSRFKKKNFSSSSRKKKDYATEYNFVFLLKKIEKRKAANLYGHILKTMPRLAFPVIGKKGYKGNNITSTKTFKVEKQNEYLPNAEIKKVYKGNNTTGIKTSKVKKQNKYLPNAEIKKVTRK